MENFIKDKLEWNRKEDYKGYNVNCWSSKDNPYKDVLIEILKDGKVIREFLFPAYKQYNIQAHFKDIVEGEIQNNASGYEIAASTGIYTPNISLEQLTPKQPL